MHMYVREEHIHIHCTCQRLRRTMTLLTFAFPAFFITVSLAENVGKIFFFCQWEIVCFSTTSHRDITAICFAEFSFCTLPSERDAVESPLFHFQLANVGEDVALSCSCRSINAFEYCWFKQGLERSPLFVTKIYSLNHNGSFSEQFNSPRFSVDIKESNYQLKISNLKISDSATYYCLAKNLKSAELCEGTTLSVKGSSFTISASLPRSKTIQPEEPETLSCTVESLTCSGEHSVYWFRESGASHRGLIYTQRGSNDQCVRKPKTQTATCEYNLPLEKLNTSNSGTYYCAVVACGHIMFGERDTMDIGRESIFISRFGYYFYHHQCYWRMLNKC